MEKNLRWSDFGLKIRVVDRRTGNAVTRPLNPNAVLRRSKKSSVSAALERTVDCEKAVVLRERLGVDRAAAMSDAEFDAEFENFEASILGSDGEEISLDDAEKILSAKKE